MNIPTIVHIQTIEIANRRTHSATTQVIRDDNLPSSIHILPEQQQQQKQTS